MDKSPALSVRSSQLPPVLPDNQLGMEETPNFGTPLNSPKVPPLNVPLASPATPAWSEVPNLDDTTKPRPMPGTLHLSEGAIDQRLRRLMTPKANGQYKVSKDIVDMFNAGGKGKTNVFHMFQSVGFDPDWCTIFCWVWQIVWSNSVPAYFHGNTNVELSKIFQKQVSTSTR